MGGVGVRGGVYFKRFFLDHDFLGCLGLIFEEIFKGCGRKS